MSRTGCKTFGILLLRRWPPPGNIAAHAIHVADLPNGPPAGGGPRPCYWVAITALEKGPEGKKGRGCAAFGLGQITPR